METKHQHLLDQQKEVWNRFSSGWKKWDNFVKGFLQPIGAAMIDALHLEEKDNVLDVATGTGEPGLTIAAIVRKGEVMGIDVSEQMLAIAKEKAIHRGIENYHVQVADAEELPFKNEEFDGVTCRMGFMFFPDMDLAAKEMFRVLKPGGRLVIAVWGAAAKNFWITAMMGVISKHIEIPVPAPNMPGMFRCAEKNLMVHILKNAGFKNIVETEITGKADYTSVDDYWNNMLEVSAPVVTAMDKADVDTKARIKQDVYHVINDHCKDGSAKLEYAALVIFADK